MTAVKQQPKIQETKKEVAKPAVLPKKFEHVNDKIQEEAKPKSATTPTRVKLPEATLDTLPKFDLGKDLYKEDKKKEDTSVSKFVKDTAELPKAKEQKPVEKKSTDVQNHSENKTKESQMIKDLKEQVHLSFKIP